MASKSLYRIFVANLPWTVSHSELKQYFSQFGNIVSANVVFDKNTGRSRKYGFVVFSSKSGYDAAVNRQKHHLEGNDIEVADAKSS